MHAAVLVLEDFVLRFQEGGQVAEASSMARHYFLCSLDFGAGIQERLLHGSLVSRERGDGRGFGGLFGLDGGLTIFDLSLTVLQFREPIVDGPAGHGHLLQDHRLHEADKVQVRVGGVASHLTIRGARADQSVSG